MMHDESTGLWACDKRGLNLGYFGGRMMRERSVRKKKGKGKKRNEMEWDGIEQQASLFGNDKRIAQMGHKSLYCQTISDNSCIQVIVRIWQIAVSKLKLKLKLILHSILMLCYYPS